MTFWLDTKHQYSILRKKKKHFKKTHVHRAAYKVIYAALFLISSQSPVLKGPRQPAGFQVSFFYCWVANYANSILKKNIITVREEKNKEEENSLVSLPPSLCRNFMPLISSFFNNQGLFHYCQLNGRLYVLHPIPTHQSLSLAVFCFPFPFPSFFWFRFF